MSMFDILRQTFFLRIVSYFLIHYIPQFLVNAESDVLVGGGDPYFNYVGLPDYYFVGLGSCVDSSNHPLYSYTLVGPDNFEGPTSSYCSRACQETLGPARCRGFGYNISYPFDVFQPRTCVLYSIAFDLDSSQVATLNSYDGSDSWDTQIPEHLATGGITGVQEITAGDDPDPRDGFHCYRLKDGFRFAGEGQCIDEGGNHFDGYFAFSGELTVMDEKAAILMEFFTFEYCKNICLSLLTPDKCLGITWTDYLSDGGFPYRTCRVHSIPVASASESLLAVIQDFRPDDVILPLSWRGEFHGDPGMAPIAGVDTSSRPPLVGSRTPGHIQECWMVDISSLPTDPYDDPSSIPPAEEVTPVTPISGDDYFDFLGNGWCVDHSGNRPDAYVTVGEDSFLGPSEEWCRDVCLFRRPESINCKAIVWAGPTSLGPDTAIYRRECYILVDDYDSSSSNIASLRIGDGRTWFEQADLNGDASNIVGVLETTAWPGGHKCYRKTSPDTAYSPEDWTWERVGQGNCLNAENMRFDSYLLEVTESDDTDDSAFGLNECQHYCKTTLNTAGSSSLPYCLGVTYFEERVSDGWNKKCYLECVPFLRVGGFPRHESRIELLNTNPKVLGPWTTLEIFSHVDGPIRFVDYVDSTNPGIERTCYKLTDEDDGTGKPDPVPGASSLAPKSQYKRSCVLVSLLLSLFAHHTQ